MRRALHWQLIAGLALIMAPKAVARLQALFNKDSSEPEWQAVAEKLAEALLASNRPAEALNLLDHPRLRAENSGDTLRVKF